MDLQQNPFSDLIPNSRPAAPAQQAPQPYTIGRPDPMRLQAEQRAQAAAERAARADERAAAAAERSAANVPAGYRPAQGGGLEPIPGGPADPNRPQPTAGSARLRQLPNQQIQRLTDGATSLANLERALNSFQDNYGGNLFGGIENTLQGVNSRIGTPGQNQFWSDVAATDNVARNALFGASLTDGERQAWQATTISPSMDPALIRQNLTRRIEIARNALGRLARTNAANGYNREAIEASLDQYSDLLRQGTVEGSVDQMAGAAGQTALAGAVSGDGDFNFSQQVQHAPPGSPERFQMLDRLHRAVQAGDVQAYIGGEGEDPSQGINQYGLTREQTDALLNEYQQELPRQQSIQQREQFNRDHPVLGGADTFMRSAANAVTLGGADRIAAAMNGTTPEQEHAITSSDWSNRPVLSFGGTLAGGSVLPLGGNALRQMGSGALYGGTYGYLGSDGSQGDRLQNALIGAGGGATIAGLVAGGMRMAGMRPGGGGGSGSSASEVADAARRQGVDIMPADLGNPTVARVTGGMRQTIGGAGPVARGAQRTEQQVGARVNALAQSEGAPSRQEVLGDVARTSLENYNAGSGEYGRNLYANARDLANGTRLQGSRANAILNRDLQELQATRNTDAPLIAGLERLQADIAPNGNLANLTVDQMRRLRTTVRSEAQTDALRVTDYQRRAKDVLDALSEDIASALPPAARREFQAADRAWAERLDFIDHVENNILGPKNNRSPELVAQRLLNMTRSDSAGFARVLDTVSAEESGMIRGSAIQELGRAGEGSPNAGGFSLDTFLTNYEKLPARSRALLFRGQSRQDIEDLATIARARRTANQSGNFSGTAGAINTSGALNTVSGYGGISTVGLSTLIENLTGRMLASPRLVRAITNQGRDPNRLVRTLRRIAVAEPAIRSNIDALIQAVQRSGQNLEPALRAAATPQDNRQNR